MKIRRSMVALFAVSFLLFMNDTSVAENSCCNRSVATTPISMPEPEEANCSAFLNGSINMVLTENYVELDDCPVKIEVMDYTGVVNIYKLTEKIAAIDSASKAEKVSVSELIDYLFISTLTLTKVDEVVDGEWETGYEGQPNWVPGYVRGDWELKLDLVDSARDKVVRSGSTTWSGTCFGAEMIATVVNLVNTRFMPLDDIIFDYERIPDTARVVPAAPRVEAGTEATFSITGIKDEEGRQSAPFQRLLVSVDMGRVVNGFDKDPYRVFEVGPSGTVQIRYKAPDECVDQTATLEVFNSCNINDGLSSTITKKKLTTSEIQIHCTPQWRWRGTLSFDRALEYHCGHTWQQGETGREIQARDLNSATGVISLVTNEGDDPPSVLTESDMRLGGSIFLLQDEFDEQWWRGSKGVCKNQVVTPGGWMHKTNFRVLQRTCTLANASLSLSFTDLTPEEAAAVAQEMANGSVASSLSSGEGGRGAESEYVRVIFLLGLECQQKVKIEQHDYRYDCCQGTIDDVEPVSGFITVPAFTYMGQLEGTINRKKNGEVTIEAVAEGAKVVPDGYPEFTVWGCPARVTMRDSTKLVLRRRRVR